MQDAPEHFPVAVVQPLPKVVPDEGHFAASVLVFFRREIASQRELQFEHVHHVVGDLGSPDALRFASTRQIEAVVREEGHRVECGVFLPPRVEVRIRDAHEFEVPLRRRLIQIHQPVRFREGERPQKQAVENAENRGVSRDPEREHPDHHQAEPRLGFHRADSEFEIVR